MDKKVPKAEIDKSKDIYKYKPYKDFLSMQEVENYKNKYDNRLYASYRFKIWSNRVEAADELFMKTRNTQILAHGKFQRARHNSFQMRLNIWYFMNWFGSNRYGEKKLYKIFQYQEPMANKGPFLALLSGFFLCFVALSYHYHNKRHDVWLGSFGDFVPFYEKLGNSKARYYWRKLRYYIHYWKMVSIYSFTKYDYRNFCKDTGISTVMMLERMARYQEYHNRRDSSFDFMKLGEDDFLEFDDKLV